MIWAAILAAPLVFISYARADRAPVSFILNKLERAGCYVWHDTQLQPGDRWQMAIERAIDRADIFLAVLGAPCNTCRDEIHRAHRLGKWIAPMLLRPDADIPLLLEQFQQIEEDKITELCK
jgi:hypothetical protein